MSELTHSIKVAAQRSGLTPHVIRVWERRYGAVQPERTGTNRRSYSDVDIERLRLLRHATAAGHSIGRIAKATTDALRELVASAKGENIQTDSRSSTPALESFQDQAMTAIRALDSSGLDEILVRASVALGNQGLLQRLIVPLAHEVGERWQSGDITAAHEHFASAVIRSFLANSAKPFAVASGAPNLVVGTPAGQLHELGAIIVSAAAQSLGWNVTYLGVGLPAAELAGAAIQNRSRAVALSIVYPEDDPNLPLELTQLRRFLPADTRIIAGGRAAPSYRQVLTQIGALQLDTLDRLYPVLESLRSARAAVKA